MGHGPSAAAPHVSSLMRLRIHVHPGSTTPSIGGTYDGVLAVHVHARAVDGEATKELLVAIADAFNVRRGAVTLVRGAASRTKTLNVEGDEVTLDARLRELLGQAV